MSNRAKVYQGLLVIIFGVLVFYFIFKYQWMLYICLAVGSIGMLSFSLSQRLYGAWMKLAEILGWINSRVLLSIVFFLFLTPIALAYRWLKKSTIQKKPNAHSESFYETIEHTFTKTDLEKMW